MLKAFFADSATGRILYSSSNSLSEVSGQLPPGVVGFRIYQEAPNPATHYVADLRTGELAAFGTPPTAQHTWDWLTCTWLPPTADVIATALASEKIRQQARVTAACDKLSDSPVLVQGARYDADATARANISAVRERIRAGLGLPVRWAGWRDADNVLHFQEMSPDAVAAFLDEVIAVIADRRQALYSVAWDGKDQINKAQTSAAAVASADAAIANMDVFA